MNNSNELSTKLVQSLPTECKQAVEKYGEQYALFLDKYPTLQNRTDAITSVYDSVSRGGMSFVEIDKYFKDGDAQRNTLTEFNSNNTRLLDKEEIKAKMMGLTYIQERLAEE